MTDDSEALAVLAALVGALPKCTVFDMPGDEFCGKLATHKEYVTYQCDDHKQTVSAELPYAAPLRAAVALLAGRPATDKK